MGCLTRWGWGRVVMTMLLLLALGQGGTLALGNVTLGGVVYGGGTPLANVTVKLINASTSAQVGSDVTDAAGQYSFSVANGTYNLQFFPPAGSGFDNAVSNGIAVAGTNVVQNIVLVAKTLTLGGKVRTPDNIPLRNVWVKAYPMSGGNGQPADSAQTDAAGNYVLNLPAGIYYCNLNGDDTCGLTGAPSQWGINSVVSNLVLNTNAGRDFMVPYVRVQGTVSDPNHVALGGISVSFNGSGPQVTGGAGWAKHTLTSSNSFPLGSYSLALIPGTYDVILTPPRGSGIARTQFRGNQILDHGTWDFSFPAAIKLSGVVRASDGTALRNVWLKAYPMAGGDGTPFDSIATDANGAYLLYLSPGRYYCSVNGNATCGLADAPSSWGVGSVFTDWLLDKDTAYNLYLPFVHLSGSVVDRDNHGVGGISLAFDGSETVSGVGSVWLKHTLTSSAAAPVGGYSLSVLTCTYNVSLTPPDGTIYAKTDYNGVVIHSDTVRNWLLNGALRLSGKVRAGDGTPLRGVWIKAYPMSGGNGLPADAAATDAAGSYLLNLPAGTYYCNLSGTDTCGVPGVASQWGVSSILSNINIASDAIRDLTVPFVKLSGRVTDSAGMGVGGVSIAVDGGGALATGGNGWARHTAVSASTVPLGSYSVVVPPGKYNETLTPADGSGFAQTNLANVSILADLLQNILLTRLGSLDPRPSTLSFLRGSGYEVDVTRGGAPRTRTIRLYNKGSQAVTFTGGAPGTPGLALTGRCAGDFAIQSVSPSTSAPLPPGQGVNITIKFAPGETVPTAGLDAALVISSDNPVVPTLTVPLLGDAVPVELSGFRVE